VEWLVPGRVSSASRLGAVALGVFALALGCGRSRDRVPPAGSVPSEGGDTGVGTGGRTGAGGNGGTPSGGNAGSGGTAGAEPPARECQLAPSGVVRLSFHQVKVALGSLLGGPAADEITLGLEIPTNETADFPELLREGTAFDLTNFKQLDAIAQATGAYVRTNAEAVTACTVPLEETCARTFVADFAERAFRKTAESGELDLVLGVFDGAIATLGATVDEALDAGIQAVVESPRFVYRYELGAPDAAAGNLALLPHEMANALSFFLTAGPPDDELLLAAESGALSSPAELEPHVARLLATDAARARLAGAVGAHLGVGLVSLASKDPLLFPTWNAALSDAMLHEGRLFLSSTLWTEPLPSLLTSRTSYVNEPLSALYGVAFPPLDSSLDADGFARVELPEHRSGLLTQAGLLASQARSGGTSLMARALGVYTKILCGPPPLGESESHPEIQDGVAGGTTREAADVRAQTPLCASCHDAFDPYGILLEEFDAIGAFRQVDEQGRPLVLAVTLPQEVGAARVANTAELGRVLAERDDFARCLGAAFLSDATSANWAVADPARSCEVDGIVREFAAGSDPSFAGLVRAIALSPAFRERMKREAL
jgi:hypothetical protein